MKHKVKYLVLYFCLCFTPVLSPTLLNGQSIGRILGKGDFEIGFTERSYERNFNDLSYPRADWSDKAVFVKIGLTNWLTTSFEGYAFKINTSTFPDRDYKEYHVGLGIATLLWTTADFYFLFGLDYTENLFQDRSPTHYDKLEQNFFACIEVEKHISFKMIDCSVFMAPAFVWDEADNIPPFSQYYRDVSIHNLGLAAGLDFLAFNHARILTQYVYADYWQYRFAVGYIF